MAEETRIVFPTDFSKASEAGLVWARRVAETLDATVHCVTSVQSPIIFQPSEGLVYPTMDEIRKDADARLEAFVEEHLSSLKQPVKTAVLSGRASDEIVTYANDIGAEMIVMATNGHSGLAHIVIGSTTENVLRHAKCPVLSIRA